MVINDRLNQQLEFDEYFIPRKDVMVTLLVKPKDQNSLVTATL